MSRFTCQHQQKGINTLLTHELSGVIFDLDNTLVTSSLNFDQIRSSLGCPKEQDLLNFIDSLPESERHEANQLLIKYEMADAHDAKKLAGTDEILALLSELNIPCAIVTRNCQQAASTKIQNNGIDISLVLTREEHKAKPAPDALLYLAQYWGKPTDKILYVGDYLYDLQAAQNARTMSCLLTYGRTLDYAGLANLAVDDLTELSRAIAFAFNVRSHNGIYSINFS
jgi:HAD superfamily hydrolase (TIGR01549 family)